MWAMGLTADSTWDNYRIVCAQPDLTQLLKGARLELRRDVLC